MPCSSYGISQILVGLHRVGMVGLTDALRAVDDLELDRREEILDRLIDRLAVDNYIPEPEVDDYRRALWRELLRFRGEDFSGWLSQLDVVIYAQPGKERDRFATLLKDVAAELELEPLIAYKDLPLTRAGSDLGKPSGSSPENRVPASTQEGPILQIQAETFSGKGLGRERLKTRLRKALSDW